MNYEYCVYKNLASEMVKRNVTVCDLKFTLNKKSNKCVREKLQGKTKLSLEEAKKIHSKHFKDCEFLYLFKKEEI